MLRREFVWDSKHEEVECMHSHGASIEVYGTRSPHDSPLIAKVYCCSRWRPMRAGLAEPSSRPATEATSTTKNAAAVADRDGGGPIARGHCCL